MNTLCAVTIDSVLPVFIPSSLVLSPWIWCSSYLTVNTVSVTAVLQYSWCSTEAFFTASVILCHDAQASVVRSAPSRNVLPAVCWFSGNSELRHVPICCTEVHPNLESADITSLTTPK
jgi:hypothetical protein